MDAGSRRHLHASGKNLDTVSWFLESRIWEWWLTDEFGSDEFGTHLKWVRNSNFWIIFCRILCSEMSASSKWVRNSSEMSSKLKMFELFSAESCVMKWVRTQNEFRTHFPTHPRARPGRPAGRSAWNRGQKMIKKCFIFWGQLLLRVRPLFCPPFGNNVSSFGRPDQHWS